MTIRIYNNEHSDIINAANESIAAGFKTELTDRQLIVETGFGFALSEHIESELIKAANNKDYHPFRRF